MHQEEKPDIDKLISRISALELANKSLQQQVTELKKERKIRSNNKPSNVEEHRNNPKPITDIYLDRHSCNIELRDSVYIITNGAHTDRSRRGTVNSFNWHRN